jgi:hypothetical protein
MSTDPDVTGIVRSWLDDGAMALPDRVLDVVLDQLPTTPQRRAHRPAWRFPNMTAPIRFAVAAAAAIGLFAAVGSIVLPRTTGPGGPNLVSGSPSPAPSAIPFPGPGALAPGMYQGQMATGLPGQWTVTVPDGWEQFYEILWADVDGVSDYTKLGGPGEVAFGWWSVANVFADPCHWKDSLADPPVGPTVDDLVTAFLGQVGVVGSGPTDVTFAGLPAKRIELAVPADLAVSTCDDGYYWQFVAPGDSVTSHPDPTQRDASGRISVMYIMDIDGARLVMNTWHYPETSASHLAELEAMLASVRIDMPTPSPSPVPISSAAG